MKYHFTESFDQKYAYEKPDVVVLRNCGHHDKTIISDISFSNKSSTSGFVRLLSAKQK